MKKINKLISILLVMAMLLSMAPIAMLTATAANISTSSSTIQKGHYIYFGSSGQKWRVLDNAKTSTGGSGMFLWSVNSLGETAPSKNYSSDVTYSNNGLKGWCTNYINGNNFTVAEKGAILATTKTADTGTFQERSFTRNYGDGALNGDKLFLLSASEALNTAYFADQAARDVNDFWYLRSICFLSSGNNMIASVANNGVLYPEPTNNLNYPMHPAFNLDTTKIIFVTAATGGKTNGLTAVSTSGSEWKLTLKDSNSFANGASISKITLCAGQSVTVTHKALSAISADYTNITAAVFSGDTMLYYGSVNTNTSATSSTVTLPADLTPGSYTLKLYGEEWNGDNRTDIATSTPYSVNITVQNHTGGTATCAKKAVCSNCENEYGTTTEHSYQYSASGNTITAACANAENCSNPVGTLKIFEPSDLYADGTTAKEATVENNLVDTSVEVSDITYSTADGSAPTTAGTYTASVTVGGATATVEFELIKRSAIAENFVYNAPENLVYDGTAKYATVEVSPEITGLGEITVTYYKDGEATEPVNAGTYTVKVSTADSDKYYAINDIELASFTIQTKDISDGFIILGEALTYNGTEQTQTVEKVLATGTAPEATYTVSGNKATNVGVYLLTVTGTGNFMGEAKIAYEIAVDASKVEGITSLNVKTSDKAKIEYVYNQLENAVTDLADADKRAEWDNLKSDCVEMLVVISNTADEIIRIVSEVNAYDIDTVTGDDVPNLLGLIDDANALLETDNLTAEETETLNKAIADVQSLISRYDRVSAQIGDIKDRLNNYDEATVKSSDKADIEQLIADIKDLTDGHNLTADEREYLVNADAECDMLLAKIAETKSEYDRVIAAANGYDEATVTSADKDALVQLNDDIYALALTDNVTAEEKENLQAAHDKVLGLIDKLTAISDEIKRIIEAVDKYVFESVKSSDKADIQQFIADINALLDTQNITADERALLEGADETCDKFVAKIDETVAEINRISDATNAYDEATVTSADKADIEKLIADIKALTDADNITEEERTQLIGNDEALDALLEKIAATADEIARIEEAVNSYYEESVKSTDKADLEQLIEDIKALTDATNITEDERTKLGELDATVDSLIKKIDDTAKEIERIENAVSGYDAETVTSADVPGLGKLIEDIKALTDATNITEDEKAALEEADKAIDELVEKLAEVAEEIKRVDEAVKSYDEETVKSTDSDELSQLKEDIQALIDSGNVTEEEKTALGEMIEKVEGLEDKIEETEKQLEDIGDFEESFNPETVTSDDKAAIEDAIAAIEAVNPDNLTDEQKAKYDEIKAGFEAFLEEIAETEKAVADIGVELEKFDEERVTIFWEDDIEALRAKIDELLADENMGEAEKAKLNEYKAQCDKLIEIINTPVKYFSLRFFYLLWDCICWKWNGLNKLF